MRRNFRIIMFAAVFGMIFSCAAAAFGQTRPILGGYKDAAVDNAEVMEAAEFAVSQHSEKNDVSLELVSIYKAERQSVQGSNFRMCLEVKNEDDDSQFVKVVVYRNLKKEFSLTSWVVETCGKKEE